MGGPRPRRHGARRSIAGGAALLAALALAGPPERGFRDGGAAPAPGNEPGPAALTATVTEVVDGDTIEVAPEVGTTETVRYIGVDTPESVDPDEPVQCGGRRAAAVNERLVAGRAVTLRFDAERRDIYGRLLAYVTAGDRAETVNAALVRRGWARTLEIEPNTSRAAHLARLELAAARAGRGIWGKCGPAGR